jgi:hypothetical protein
LAVQRSFDGHLLCRGISAALDDPCRDMLLFEVGQAAS